MGKILYVLAGAALVIGLFDASGGAPGSSRQMEAGILLLLAPILAIAGFFITRASTRLCPHCAERIKKAASKCRHCGSAV